MKRVLMKRFALTEKGAGDMLKAITAVTLSNMALMTELFLVRCCILSDIIVKPPF